MSEIPDISSDFPSAPADNSDAAWDDWYASLSDDEKERLEAMPKTWIL